jgi:hypothetical protein
MHFAATEPGRSTGHFGQALAPLLRGTILIATIVRVKHIRYPLQFRIDPSLHLVQDPTRSYLLELLKGAG